jgi:glycine/D-amino acid oxidase-like deaminating enzyme
MLSRVSERIMRGSILPGVSKSWWHASLPDTERVPRASLPADIDVDVAIVGAGYTGLWTAYALKRADPSLRIVVCEREIAGFGASGRNGGWCSSFFAGPQADAMQRAMFANLDAIERVVTEEQIDCDWARGGVVHVATTEAQVPRLHAELAHVRKHGFGENDYRILETDEARDTIGCRPNLGALFSPHCAAIHPAKLARNLARVVEARGVTIYERTPVTAVAPGRVTTTRGIVRAEIVVRATEAFTTESPEQHRWVAPIYSLMIATEPLSEAFWKDAGLADRPTFADYRHMIIYGQRTADDRFAFGGRGTPYHFGSRIRSTYEIDPRVQDSLHATLRSLFPGLGDARVTHRWGGAVAVPRDWSPSVGFDRATGMAWAGGYVGDGVSTTHLAGCTIADLVLGRDTDLVRLPWVGHRSRDWEPEPLRWLGVNAGRALGTSIDRAEARHREPKLRKKVFGKLLGS